jgi:WD40 repeat protein
VLTVTGDGAVRLWDLRDPRHPVRGASLGTAAVSPATGVSVQAEGSMVAVQATDGRLRLWHVTGADAVSAAGSVPASGTAPGLAGITANARAAVMFTAAGITWWDIADPARPVRAGVTPPEHMNLGIGLGVGGVFAADSGGPGVQDEGTDLYLFDVSSGRPGTGVSLSTSTGGQLCISADGRLLAATGSGNNAVTLWNIADPRRPSLLTTLPTLSAATGMAFDPGGNQLAVWNNDSVQLWDITHPDVPALQADVVPPGGGQGPIIAAAYIPVGPPRLIVATYTSVYVYDADPAHLAASICPYTGDSITRPLWNAYAPRTPYQRPCRLSRLVA